MPRRPVLAASHGCAVDLCIRLPRDTSDEHCHHAHMLSTLREVSPMGLGAYTALDLTEFEREQAGLTGSGRDEFREIRAR